MSKPGQPPRKRTTKRERAAALVHRYISELAPQLLNRDPEELPNIHKRLIDEMHPEGPYEDSLIRQIAHAMNNMNIVRDAEHVVWSLQGKIEFTPFMEMLEYLQSNHETHSKSFDRALKHLLEGQRLRRRSAHLVGALNAQQAAKAARQQGQPTQMQPTRRYPIGFRTRSQPEPTPEIKDEDLAGEIDPSTGKKKPWIN